MANSRIRMAPIYYNGAKVGALSTQSLDIASNDQRQIVIDGYMGHSDGVEVTDVEAKTIISIGDTQITELVTILKNKEYVQIGQLVGGIFLQTMMRCVSFNATSEAENGKLEGTFKFEGGATDQT